MEWKGTVNEGKKYEPLSKPTWTDVADKEAKACIEMLKSGRIILNVPCEDTVWWYGLNCSDLR
jgi:hypothetical protein